MKKLPCIVLLAGALALGPVGCTHMSRTQQGALSGAAGGALHAREQLGHLRAERVRLQVFQRDGFRIPEQGVEKTDVGACARIGLGGAGHAETKLTAADRIQKIADRHFPAHKSQLFRKALPNAEYHRRDRDGLGVLQVQRGVPDVEPQGARGPHRVVGELILLQLTHDVQRALIGHLDAHVVFIRKLLQNGLQLA